MLANDNGMPSNMSADDLGMTRQHRSTQIVSLGFATLSARLGKGSGEIPLGGWTKEPGRKRTINPDLLSFIEPGRRRSQKVYQEAREVFLSVPICA